MFISLLVIFACRKVICKAWANFDWTRTQSGRIKNSKQYEEIKFHIWTHFLLFCEQNSWGKLSQFKGHRPLRWLIKIESLMLPFVSWQTRKKFWTSSKQIVMHSQAFAGQKLKFARHLSDERLLFAGLSVYVINRLFWIRILFSCVQLCSVVRYQVEPSKINS